MLQRNNNKNINKKPKNNNSLLFISVLFVVLVICLLFLNKNTNGRNGNNGNNGNNNKNTTTGAENFTTLRPNKMHGPRYFELYKIDNINNKLDFIFSAPKPNIIANQVQNYMLVVVSFIPDETASNENNG